MEETVEPDTLSGEAKAYFDSRGELPAPRLEERPAEAEDEQARQEIEGFDPSTGSGQDPSTGSGQDPSTRSGEQPKVPLRAVTREREANRELRSRIAEMEKRSAVLEDRWNTMLALQPPQQEEVQAPPPDPDEDIFAFSRWQADQLRALQEHVAGREIAEYEAVETQRAEQAVWNFWEASAKEFAETNADFGDAARWLSGFRDNQLQALATLDPRFGDARARNGQIEEELKAIVIGAAQQGKSPAEMIYGIAKGYGYQPRKGTDGSELVRLAQNIQAETSLSDLGGSRPAGPRDAKDIADMSPGEFDAWFRKNGADGFRKLHQRG